MRGLTRQEKAQLRTDVNALQIERARQLGIQPGAGSPGPSPAVLASSAADTSLVAPAPEATSIPPPARFARLSDTSEL